MAYVISITGPPGAGKSSLANNLESRLNNAATIQFDMYEQLTDQPLDQIIEWMKEGADIDQFAIPDLAESLSILKCGHPIINPITGQTIGPAETILFETPFGRQHKESGQYIDLSLWIDIPLDIALARKIKQLISEWPTNISTNSTNTRPNWLHDYLDNYITGTQALLRMQRDIVRLSTDAIIDGTVSINDMTNQAEEYIHKYR